LTYELLRLYVTVHMTHDTWVGVCHCVIYS